LVISAVSKLRAQRELVSGWSVALLAVSFAITLRQVVCGNAVNATVDAADTNALWLEDGLAVATRRTV